jgi:hypothetical protein
MLIKVPCVCGQCLKAYTVLEEYDEDPGNVFRMDICDSCVDLPRQVDIEKSVDVFKQWSDDIDEKKN